MNAPLAMLICIAYGVQYYQVSGPGWMATDGYDVAAKIPAGTTRAEYVLMMQSLLAERFHLTLHHEASTMTAYSLVVAKSGIKLQREPERSAATPGIAVTLSNTKADNSHVRVMATREPLSNLAGFLSTKQGVESPVTNDTGLSGDYNFVLEFTPEPLMARDPNGLSLFTVLESQLV